MKIYAVVLYNYNLTEKYDAKTIFQIKHFNWKLSITHSKKISVTIYFQLIMRITVWVKSYFDTSHYSHTIALKLLWARITPGLVITRWDLFKVIYGISVRKKLSFFNSKQFISSIMLGLRKRKWGWWPACII